MQRSALCRSRRELSNAYFLAKFGLDTAENEPCQVCPTEPFPAGHDGESRQSHKSRRGSVAVEALDLEALIGASTAQTLMSSLLTSAGPSQTTFTGIDSEGT